ncbi:hypothetical protein LTR10_023933 [Elasticomyces elasticus]|uniref:ERCC4 domain-containing protein n=1 Tax=Exophiala sideris TaxID=1016849 RepID=A0ABR0JHV6_9EURO|nr:hypothetical protein LTR10_023933 [Elasticomyces elasticus]KAK5033177.1 hypothetical protein LTS07_003478 [Exophiala sideris]KAK5042323.1 hypothetical protein LTR13_002129 [Exophiala sideris]KAK5063721.1 hypothetical protein LTR69_003486 [Exophiala sideris]KAK5185590.1 hypothetical protein LTR44_002579 [Eurotiomycetes sp. CCFEE 6388]
MAEVIDLLSSSPPPLRLPKPDHVRPSANSTNLHSFSDAFDDAGSVDFAIDRPSKRQRLSPEPSTSFQPRAFASRTSKVDIVYEVLSEDDSLPDLGSQIAPSFQKSPGRRKQQDHACDTTFTFSSSAPEQRHIEKDRVGHRVGAQPEELLEDPFDLLGSLSQPAPGEVADELYSNRTANLLAVLSQEPSKEAKPIFQHFKATRAIGGGKEKSKQDPADDIEFSSSPAKPRTTKASKASETDKAAKATERAAVKAGRDAEKEAEKERKKREREVKAQEKQRAADLAEANKSRVNKKNAVPEMIVDMSGFLKGTSVGDQVEEYMRNLEVEVNYFDDEVNLTEFILDQMRYGNLVTWRRTVKSTYNDEDGQWEPASKSRIMKEKHVLVHLPAVEFAAIATVRKPRSESTEPPTESQMQANLDTHVASLRQRFGDCIPIYLIEGLNGWLKKTANARNREYTTAVRAQLATSTTEPGPARTRLRKPKKPSTDLLDLSSVTSDIVDGLLLHLQLAHQPILIHHTTSPGTTASQISALTQHLATRPYRMAQLDFNLKSASFCMDSGQVRTGDDARDTFVKMLQEVQRVTPSMAYGIVDKFESVRALVTAFDRNGNLLLEDVRKSANKDGAWSDKRLGPMVSKRLYKVFMGRDPSSTDGMS